MSTINPHSLEQQIPDGTYALVGIRNIDKNELLLGKELTIQFGSFLNLRGVEASCDFMERKWEQMEVSNAYALQAKMEGRPSLSPYLFHATVEKLKDQWSMFWGMIHTGNPTDDERNHPPFYVTFRTQGTFKDYNLNNMAVVPDSTSVRYCEHFFNGQSFSDGEITSRIAKPKHLGAYSTSVTLSEPKIEEAGLAGRPLIEFTEENGFGAPRHLLCGKVDAKMSYIFTPITRDIVPVSEASRVNTAAQIKFKAKID